MSKYKGLFTFDEDNHRYIPVAQADGIIDTMNYEQDSKPVEPLIKDEKIRKAVRAWAEANDIDKVFVQNNYCLSSEEDEEVEIVFASPVFKEFADADDFIAIAELCGEEE